MMPPEELKCEEVRMTFEKNSDIFILVPQIGIHIYLFGVQNLLLQSGIVFVAICYVFTTQQSVCRGTVVS
jgi:hypothetical protein